MKSKRYSKCEKNGVLAWAYFLFTSGWTIVWVSRITMVPRSTLYAWLAAGRHQSYEHVAWSECCRRLIYLNGELKQ